MNTPTPPRLETAIRAALAPLLREGGFAGSGRRFYKRVGPWIHIVTVQGSRYGGSFAVNLGLHFASAPDLSGNLPDPKKMTEAHCEFRRRLSESNADMWWKHETDQASMLAAVESAASVYAGFGCRYFDFACTALTSITPEALASGNYDLQGFGGTKVRLGLALARIRKLEGRTQESRGFAAYGIQNAGSAGFLKTELLALAAA
jgi:Domain of unknown function (DUF4304)